MSLILAVKSNHNGKYQSFFIEILRIKRDPFLQKKTIDGTFHKNKTAATLSYVKSIL